MGWFLADENYQRVADALKALGYAHVTLDLAGYRRGGANQMMARNLPPVMGGKCAPVA